MATPKLDWVLAYQAAVNGDYGDQSQNVIDRIKTAAGSNFQEAIDKGYITPPKTSTRTVSNETGTFQKTDVDELGVNWDKLPAMPAAPKGTYFFNVGGTAGAQRTGSELAFYNDPNYGLLGLFRNQSPKDFADTYLPMMALALAGAGIAGGIAAGAGFASGSVESFATNLAVKQGLSAAFGRTPTVEGAASSLLSPRFVDLITKA